MNQKIISDATNSHSLSRHIGIIERLNETTFVYFEDAEQTENPVLFDKSVTWSKVKKRLVELVQKNF